MECINCGHHHEERFCPSCGERNGVERITIPSILNSSISSLANMDKGFLFNLKALFTHPKTFIDQYLKGRRKGILNPVSYLIFSTTLYLLVITLIKVPKEAEEAVNMPEEKARLSTAAFTVGLFIREYIKYFWIFSIVPLGLSLKLVFRKYNYPEYLAISAFLLSQATLVGILSYLLLRFPLIFDPFVFVSLFLLIFFIFKRNQGTVETLFTSLAALLIFFLQWMIIMVILAFLVS